MQLYDTGIYLVNGRTIVKSSEEAAALLGHAVTKEAAKKGTIAHKIIAAHDASAAPDSLRLTFDSLTSHDITYVGIIQTARASGMERFPVPYVLTNCHNSLCAVGGTINEDDHMFALSAAKKYGGIYVPTNLAVIHTYNREKMAGCGRMILGSDSHTRYGALGTMGVGEGGGELAKQLLSDTYDMRRPEVVCIYLEGTPAPGVGPQDVALAICAAVYKNGYVKNKVMEFIGPGVGSLPVEFRNGIDVMTTETTCWSSVWETDGRVREYYEIHGRPEAFRTLAPEEVAYYDGCVRVNLSNIESMIALPMHPSNALPIAELLQRPKEILAECEANANRQLTGARLSLLDKIHDGGVWVQQGLVAGCSGGTFDNICAAADILRGQTTGNGAFTMSVYPGSMPTLLQLLKNSVAADLASSGVILRECFCGPCFGAGDTPANNALSIRHTTRNFPNREGSKPGEGQMSGVALMDARSIAATARNGGRLTPATDLSVSYKTYPYTFDGSIYQKRVFDGFGHAEPEAPLTFGPNIRDWPEFPALSEDLLLKICTVIHDPVTTTDELIPSGETSSFRSNPERLSAFALSRKDPEYVGRSKEIRAVNRRRTEENSLSEAVQAVYTVIEGKLPVHPLETEIGSCVFARKPGDGSAREQAASCQRVLGGAANITVEYATKRYRSNCLNWGIVPFRIQPEDENRFQVGDWLFVPGIRTAVENGSDSLQAYFVREGLEPVTLLLDATTPEEKRILLDGCLINFNRRKRK